MLYGVIVTLAQIIKWAPEWWKKTRVSTVVGTFENNGKLWKRQYGITWELNENCTWRFKGLCSLGCSENLCQWHGTLKFAKRKTNSSTSKCSMHHQIIISLKRVRCDVDVCLAQRGCPPKILITVSLKINQTKQPPFWVRRCIKQGRQATLPRNLSAPLPSKRILSRFNSKADR